MSRRLSLGGGVDSTKPSIRESFTPLRARARPLPQIQRHNLKFHKPSANFQVTPVMDNESLVVHACESLASASIMTSDIAAYVDTPQRHIILAIQQSLKLAELAVNQVLDNVEVTRAAKHS